MKAIVLKQPFASLIADRWKLVETRTWFTKHRGPLLIIAGKAIHRGRCYVNGMDWDCKAFITEYYGPENPLPLGKALCIVEVTDCRTMTAQDEQAACCRLYSGAVVWDLSWIIEVPPFDVTGQQRLFEVDDDLIERHLEDYSAGVQQCRICGCTDYDCQDCIERTGDACTWSEEDLCSACVDLKCRDCGKPAEGIFHLSSDEADTESGFEHIPLCYACSKDSFCPGCHQFYAGTNEFDRNGGWCDNCKAEVDFSGSEPENYYNDFADYE